MPDASDVLWFKQQFQARIELALKDSLLDPDLITAIACQESGHIWSALRRQGLPVAQVLALCVGDTLDGQRGRSAFPRNKAELLARPRGELMFRIARQSLVAVAARMPAMAAAAALPDKFCRGFGIFQRDLQFFVSDPEYFLQRRYQDFELALAPCLAELELALRKCGLQRRDALNAHELAAVAIACKSGSFNRVRGLRQGPFNGSRFYGEQIYELIHLARAASPQQEAPAAMPQPAAG